MDSQQLIQALHEAQRALGNRAVAVRLETKAVRKAYNPLGIVGVRTDAAPSGAEVGEVKKPEIIITHNVAK